MQRLIFSLFMFIALVCQPAHAESGDWFERGERLHYLVEMWGWLNVGEAEILFKPETEEKYTILARAWTSLSAFKLRDRLTTYGVHSDVQGEGPFYSARQVIELNENDYKAHKIINFDRSAKMVRYHNIQGNEEPVGFGAPEHVRDMISALYYYRKTVGSVKVGDSYVHDVAQNDYIYRMNLSVVGKDKIDGHHSFKVRPTMQKLNLKGEPIGEAKDTWVIWVRDDESFMPQRIEAKTKFGSFVASLKHAGPASAKSRVISDIPETGEISNKNKKKSMLLETVD